MLVMSRTKYLEKLVIKIWTKINYFIEWIEIIEGWESLENHKKYREIDIKKYIRLINSIKL